MAKDIFETENFIDRYFDKVENAMVDEEEVHRADHPLVQVVQEIAAAEGASVVTICASIEAEIAQLPADEQADFLKELGYAEPGLHRVELAC